MKRIFILFLSFFIIYSLASCRGRSISDMERDAKEEALKEQYREGIEVAQRKIDDRVASDLQDLEFDIEDRYGIYAEDAVRILERYLDGDEISEGELRKAISALSEYYYESIDIMYGIDDYWIE